MTISRFITIISIVNIANNEYVLGQNLNSIINSSKSHMSQQISEPHTSYQVSEPRIFYQVLDDVISAYNLSSYVRIAPLPCFKLKSNETLIATNSLDYGYTYHHVYALGSEPKCTGNRHDYSSPREIEKNLKTPILFDIDETGTLKNISYLCSYDTQFTFETILRDYEGVHLPKLKKRYEHIVVNKDFLRDFHDIRKKYNLHNVGLELRHIICKYYCPKEPTTVVYSCDSTSKRLTSTTKSIHQTKENTPAKSSKQLRLIVFLLSFLVCFYYVMERYDVSNNQKSKSK